MNLLAFDTSTDTLSIAVQRSAGATQRTWQYAGAGGAQASSVMIGHILDLLAPAQLQLRDLDAICFGSGPGSFTGLRTACAVAQGLAYGANVPVLPVDSLLAVAEEARFASQVQQTPWRVTALLDARMDEMYAATWSWSGKAWSAQSQSMLLRPENLRAALTEPAVTLAGNVFGVYADRIPRTAGGVGFNPPVTALPTASAMLRLAPALLASGHGIAAAQALPHYIRDKVAKTTVERDAEKAKAAQP